MAYPVLNKLHTKYVTGVSSSANIVLPAPFRGKVTQIDVATMGTVAAADTVTCSITGSAITGGAASVTTSTANNVFSVNPTGNNFCVAGDTLEAVSSSATLISVTWHLRSF